MKSLLTLVFVVMSVTWGMTQDAGAISEGMLDLRDWDPAAQPSVPLNGQWEFYWNKLILFKDRANNEGSFAQVSIPWNEQRIGGEVLPKDGSATYMLTVLLPTNTDSVAFAVPAVFNSYAFFVNDVEICSSGKVGLTKEQMTPQWRPKTVSVAVPGDTVHVVFQISNFQHTRGGCAEIMRIGTPAHLVGLDSAFHTSGILLIILFFVTGITGLIICFIMQSKGFLYLGLLALSYTIRFLYSDLYFAFDFGVNLNWEWMARIEYLTLPLIVLCAAQFIASIYPQEFINLVRYGFVFTSLALILLTLLVPSGWFSPLLVVLQIHGLILALYTIYVVLRALIFQRKGAWVTAVGVGVFAVVGFYNIYAFVTLRDLDRTVIHIGYGVALILNIVSLVYRSPMRLRSEEQEMLRFSDFYGGDQKARI